MSEPGPGEVRGEPGHGANEAGPGFRLLAITPPVGPVDPALVRAWAPAAAVGLAVLLREPGTPPAALVSDAHRLAPLRRACAQAGWPCLLSVDGAALSEAAEAIERPGIVGIQLRGDPAVALLEQARRILPPGARLGRSCHGRPAPVGARVDYSVLAPIFAPRTRSPEPGPGKRPVGLEPLRALCAVERHVFALGGIEPGNARACLRAGAHGLAAIRSFFGALPDVTDNVARLARALVEPGRARP